MRDVKEVADIPNIEHHLDKKFILTLYEVGDNLQIYKHQLNPEFFFNLEIHCKERLIEGKAKLVDLITQDGIEYLQFSLINNNSCEVVDSFCYRPLVEDTDKDYSWIK